MEVDEEKAVPSQSLSTVIENNQPPPDTASKIPTDI